MCFHNSLPRLLKFKWEVKLAEMRNIRLYLTELISRVKSLSAFPWYKNKRSDDFFDGAGNLQVKIIRTLLLIPLVLFLEAEYYLVVSSNNIFTYTPIKISSITPKSLNTQETIFTSSMDTSEINIGIRSDSTRNNFLRLSLKPGGSIYKGIVISLHDSIPMTASLNIKCRSYSRQTVCQIGLIDSLSNATSREAGAYYFYTTIPDKKWADLTIPISLFKKNKSNTIGITTGYPRNYNIQKIKVTFYPKVNTTIDISDISFEWSITKWQGITLLLIILSVGALLFFRTSPRNQNFSAGLDLASSSITARAVFFVVAISAFISAFTNSIPAYHNEVYLIYLSFLLMICIDELYTGEITRKTIWSLRYFLIITAVWLLQITDNTFILSPLTFAVFIPVIQQRRRLLLLLTSAGLLIVFIVINKLTCFISDTTGALIIVAASVIAVVLKEILFYELLKSETNYAKFLYENLFENSYDGIYTTEESGIIKTANYGFGNMLGYPIEEVMGRNIFEFVVEEDSHLLKQLMKEAVSKDFNMCDINFVDINKGIHTSLIRLVAVYKNNVLTGYQSIATDITERKRSEQELWKSQSRYKALLNALPDLVLKFTHEGILLDYHTHKNEDSTEYYEKLLGKSINNVFEPHITQYFLIHAENALRQNLPQIFEYESGINGEVFYKEARIVPIQNDNFIAIIRDITDRRHAEFKIQEYLLELDDNRTTLENNSRELADLNFKLEEINKSKDKFFSIVAHDLRSPFTGLLGFSDILSTQLESLTTDEIKTYAGHLNHSLKNVFKLLENLLDWSRMQTGKIKFEAENFNLEEVIQRIVGIFQINASEKKIDIKIVIEPCLNVFADEDMVDITIRNLLSNAIKFTRPGGKICIHA